MTQPNGENEDVLPPIRNTVVDAWNDAPSDADVRAARAALFPPPRVGQAPAAPLTSAPLASAPLASAPFASEPFVSAPPAGAPLASAPARPAPTGVNTAPVPQALPDTDDVLPLLEPALWVIGFYLLMSGVEGVVDRATLGSFSSATWRFGTVGGVSPSIVSLVLSGGAFTFAVVTRGRKRIAYVLMAFFALIALALLLVLPLFVLDFLQVRPTLPAQLTGRSLALSVGLALGNMLFGVVSFTIFIFTLRKSNRRMVAAAAGPIKDWDK